MLSTARLVGSLTIGVLACALISLVVMASLIFSFADDHVPNASASSSSQEDAVADATPPPLDSPIEAESGIANSAIENSPPRIEPKPTEAETRSAKDAEEARVAAAAEVADDTATARKWGISLASYRRAKAHQTQAYWDCVDAIKNSARYEVKSDWLMNYDWLSDGNTIVIIGHDMHLQNGFGAFSSEYTCNWDIRSGTITKIAG